MICPICWQQEQGWPSAEYCKTDYAPQDNIVNNIIKIQDLENGREEEIAGENKCAWRKQLAKRRV